MNKLQEIELELLQYFVDICERLDLRYYLVCGSALGAVKYGGFIPWDDDVDVALPRPDYEVFCEKAQALLPEYVFLQNYKTDPHFPHIFSKLRNSNTTFIEKSIADLNINHGVYIDVFPLDGYPESVFEIWKLEMVKTVRKHQLASATNVPRGLKSKAHCFFYRALGYHRRTYHVAAKYEQMITRYNSESALLCNHGNWHGRLDYSPASQYGMGAVVSFEGIDVRIPENADEYLKQKYGNYWEDPPVAQQEGHHYCVKFDPARSYLEYID